MLNKITLVKKNLNYNISIFGYTTLYTKYSFVIIDKVSKPLHVHIHDNPGLYL